MQQRCCCCLSRDGSFVHKDGDALMQTAAAAAAALKVGDHQAACTPALCADGCRAVVAVGRALIRSRVSYHFSAAVVACNACWYVIEIQTQHLAFGSLQRHQQPDLSKQKLRQWACRLCIEALHGTSWRLPHQLSPPPSQLQPTHRPLAHKTDAMRAQTNKQTNCVPACQRASVPARGSSYLNSDPYARFNPIHHGGCKGHFRLPVCIAADQRRCNRRSGCGGLQLTSTASPSLLINDEAPTVTTSRGLQGWHRKLLKPTPKFRTRRPAMRRP